MRSFALALMATVAAAENLLTFVNMDSGHRTITFTPNSGGYPSVDSVEVPGNTNVSVPIPDSWQGNFYSTLDNCTNVPGMLGEVAFQAWEGINFFDVSAIVNATDNVGVKQMIPGNGADPISGCLSYLQTCTNAYNLWDDVQTKSTTQNTIVVTLGDYDEGAFTTLKSLITTLSKRDVNAEEPGAKLNFPRQFIDGTFSKQQYKREYSRIMAREMKASAPHMSHLQRHIAALRAISK